MFRRLGRKSLVVALIAMLSAHWAFLQTIAWTGMIVCYSEHASLKVALRETFDGKHPCPLCRAIAAAKKSQKKSEFTAQTQKLEFPPTKETIVVIAPSQFQFLPQFDCFADSFIQKPPVPPPRGFFI